MAQRLSQPENINILISNADWAWPQAVASIFQPRGVNALVAQTSAETVRIIANNRIQLAILDDTGPTSGCAATSSDTPKSGMNTLKLIRKHDQLIPCILVAREMNRRALADALALNVFSVVAKPVDMSLLVEQMDRLFMKYYASNIFSLTDR